MKDLRNIIRGIPKVQKIDFLKKLQSGKYSLVAPYSPKSTMNFTLQPDGLYICKETGQVMSRDKVLTLPGFKIKIELIDNKAQISGEEPASGYCLVPYSKDEYLDSLLRGEQDMTLTFDEKKQLFKCERGDFTFEEIMNFCKDNPDVRFFMDEDTKRHYMEHLERYC